MHPNVAKHFQLKTTLNYACENTLEIHSVEAKELLIISWSIDAALFMKRRQSTKS